MEHAHNLIQQILLGKTELFEQIVLKYQDLVFTVCLNIVKDEHTAENMAQEAFLAAYCALSDFHGNSFKSWLCKIAVNKSIDYKRKYSKMEIVDCTEQDLHINDVKNIDELLIQSERKEKLEHILSNISPKYQAVIRAFYFDQLSVKEISQRLKMSERTIETRLYRARQIIKERWDKDGA